MTSLVTNANDNLKQSNRRVLVCGPRASGKTTLSISASRFAPDTLPAYGERREATLCKDTLVIQGDNEGIMGAMDAGLEPAYVLDMTSCETWAQYQARVIAGLKELAPRFAAGELKIVVVDLALPAKLIDRSIDPSVQKDWKLVANQGGNLFRMLSALPGVTIIGNAQIKAAVSPGETAISADAATAKAIGGQRSTFTIDLPKGIASHWLDNCSFVFARAAKRTTDAKGNVAREFATLTQSSNKFEAKSRAESRLSPREPGDATLHALLRRAYGDGH